MAPFFIAVFRDKEKKPRPRVPWLSLSAEPLPNSFVVAIFVDGMHRAIATEARLLEAAERRGKARNVIGVDPHRAGVNAFRNTMRLTHVGREHRSGQPIVRVIGELQ